MGGFLLTAILTWLFRGPLMLLTVLVHELTHVFSALAFLGRHHSIEANASGNGLARLSVSMDNFFVLLVPYSVPLLALAWLPVRGLASKSAMHLYGAVLGALLAWHTTSVLQSFRAYQSDLQLSGLLLSWLVCHAGNLVLVGFILATGLQGWRAGLSHMEAGLDRTSIIARSLVSSVPLARRTEQGRPLRPPARPSRVGGGWKELGGARMESTDVRR